MGGLHFVCQPRKQLNEKEIQFFRQLLALPIGGIGPA
jgi:hypothetical protein